jgi:hypothetical protein
MSTTTPMLLATMDWTANNGSECSAVSDAAHAATLNAIPKR